MKILLLLSGYTCKRIAWGEGDKGTPLPKEMDDFWNGRNYLKNLLKNHRVETICTLWDNLGFNEVNKEYNPRICLSLDQKIFQDNLKLKLKDYEKKRIQKRNKWLSKRKVKNNLVGSSDRIASQLFCREMVCKKAIEFLNQSSYEPELIILTRYDIGIRGGVAVRNPCFINDSINKFLNKNKNQARIIIPTFNQLNIGLPDMWFYMNVGGLLEFKSIYTEYENSLCGVDNRYLKLLTEGWPDSEWFEYTNISDKRQFSNIILNNQRSERLMKYEDWELPNTHAFYKYFILLRDSKFQIKFLPINHSLFSMFLFGNKVIGIKSIIHEIYSSIKTRSFGFIKKLIYQLKR
tara:strand:- start:5516 stop:6559 length:1044 start_codon:yes stop_codon:yes gene_type:complete